MQGVSDTSVVPLYVLIFFFFIFPRNHDFEHILRTKCHVRFVADEIVRLITVLRMNIIDEQNIPDIILYYNNNSLMTITTILYRTYVNKIAFQSDRLKFKRGFVQTG